MKRQALLLFVAAAIAIVAALPSIAGADAAAAAASPGPFQSGYDVGAYCIVKYPNNKSSFDECCSVGCFSLHGYSDTTGFQLCYDKCESFSWMIGSGQSTPSN